MYMKQEVTVTSQAVTQLLKVRVLENQLKYGNNLKYASLYLPWMYVYMEKYFVG